jgi:2-polyprenyl-6-methoxyphenol hydroxylase-like FAD-dependent oxidoreductase
VQVLRQTGALEELGGEAALTPVCDLPVYACTAADGPVRLLYSLRAAAPRAGALGVPPPRDRIAYSAEQWRVERALLDSLARRPGAVVRRGTRLLGLHCCERGVTVRLAVAAEASEPDVRCAPDEARSRPGSDVLRCKYLVAADGVGGSVRAALGVGRSGAPYEELFLIADVQLAGFTCARAGAPAPHTASRPPAQLRPAQPTDFPAL